MEKFVAKMGSSASKKVGGDETTNTLIHNPKTSSMTENGGFHLFEIHLPTVGFSMATLLCIIFVAGIALLCYKKFVKASGSDGLFQAQHVSMAPVPAPLPGGVEMLLMERLIEQQARSYRREFPPLPRGPPPPLRTASRFEDLEDTTTKNKNKPPPENMAEY